MHVEDNRVVSIMEGHTCIHWLLVVCWLWCLCAKEDHSPAFCKKYHTFTTSELK
jgi:hypothetical protein